MHTDETLNEGKGTHLLRIFKNMFLLHNLVGPIVFKVKINLIIFYQPMRYLF